MFVCKYISFKVLSLVSYESYVITIFFHAIFFSCHVIFNLMHLFWVQFALKGTLLLSHPPFLFGVEHSILILDRSIYCLFLLASATYFSSEIFSLSSCFFLAAKIFVFAIAHKRACVCIFMGSKYRFSILRTRVGAT